MDIVRKHFPSIDSTNTWGKQYAQDLPRDKITLVTADQQTAGRGRFKRHWVSPPNQNIYATFCFFIEKHHSGIGNIPQVLALSTAAVLKELQFQPTLKWPNDILLSRKKVAGILAETTPLSDQLCVVIGIGVNINMPLDLLQQIDRPATSLLAEASRSFDVEEVLQRLTCQFSSDLDRFLAEGFFPFLELYRSYLSLDRGKTIQFHDNRTVWEGVLHGVNNDGSLNLQLPNGDIKTFIAGEILTW